MAYDANNIRNFCIIAHIDHGKSTLADRLLEQTGTLSKRQMTQQVLDSMDIERERGITIKLRSVRMEYRPEDGQIYHINLIDTPGHVDFSYEVSRSLAACEGALLVVDAAQGIEAQTLANLYLALEHDLDIIPVINKIDLPNADPDRIMEDLEDLIGLGKEDVILVSAKTGEGVDELLDAIIYNIRPPKGDEEAPLRALVFDSHFDPYKGVICYLRVVDGVIRPGMDITMMSTGKTFEVQEVGLFKPDMTIGDSLKPGEVGFLTASIKNVKDARVGDTITGAENPSDKPLPGYKSVTPLVYCGLYPTDSSRYEDLRTALEKLQLNDASLSYEPETSIALGFGFRCGFLGLLHMEIVQERLEREYELDLITSAPSVVYKVRTTDDQEYFIHNPSQLTDEEKIESVSEPYVNAKTILPQAYVGPIMELCQDKRGIFINMEYINKDRVMLTYELPFSEILYDFYDKLKSRSRGFASFDYEYIDHRPSDLVKLDIMVNGEIVDALSSIVHKDKAYTQGRQLASKLRKLIPRQMFEVAIQAAVGKRVIARETVSALRKDVLQKCYGGDVSRKRKLLEKQKEGKKRMKQFGNVEIPQEAFMAVLQLDE